MLYFVRLLFFLKANSHNYTKHVENHDATEKNYFVCVLRCVVCNTHLLIPMAFKTEAAVFSCRLCFLRAFPFISLISTLFTTFFLLTTSLLFIFRVTDTRVYIKMHSKYNHVLKECVHFPTRIQSKILTNIKRLYSYDIIYVCKTRS